MNLLRKAPLLVLLLVAGLLPGFTPAAAATSSCTVAYSVTNSWSGGFQASVTITDDAAAITGWTLAFTFPDDQAVTNLWGGTYTQNGQNLSVTNAAYDGSLATGGSTTIGFTGTVGAANSLPDYFTINGLACNGATQRPAVSLTSPTANQLFTTGANITLSATASDPTASIASVKFYAGTTLLGTVTSSPYSFVWSAPAAGYYALSAVAVNANGGTGTSTTVSITVATPASLVAPQLHVSGNELVDASGKQVVLHGVNRSGGEFACVQNNGIWDGPMDAASVQAIKSWGVTAVRVPLNEACWNGESYVNSAYAGAAYQQAVQQYVSVLNSYGIVPILDLHWTDGAYTGTSAGCSSAQATCQKPMPDAAEAVPFWTSVASTFKGNNSVIFDLFNEPYPERADNYNETEGWTCWRDGGSACTGISYTVSGMQTLVTAIRGTGAANVIMLGGLEYANDLTQWLTYKPADPDNNLVASWHSYSFNTCSTQSCWTSQIAPVIAAVPVIVGEMGENECSDTYITPLMTWLDSQHTGYLAWTWNTWGCANGNVLITDYTGTPTAFGAGYRDHLQTLGG